MATNKHGHYSDPVRYSADEAPEPETHLSADYVNSLEPIRQRKARAKRNRLIFLTVLAVVAVLAALYFLLLQPKPATAPPAQQVQQTEQAPRVNVDEPTDPYVSDAFGLSFDHPKSWQPEDTGQELVVRSPVGKLADSTGAQVDGRIVVSFTAGGGKVPGYATGEPVAVIESQKLTYAKPSQNQRKQTYLSFVNFSQGGGIQEIFVTGDSGYKKGQVVPQVDVKKVDPIIRLVFEKCQGETCGSQAGGALVIAEGEWQKNPLLIQAEKLLQSLKVQ